jgi:integrase/recombinase XerD
MNDRPSNNNTELVATKEPAPTFLQHPDLNCRVRELMSDALRGWLRKTPSIHTRVDYRRDLEQFLSFVQMDIACPEHLVNVRPNHVARWRDELKERGFANSTIRRKITTLRAFFSYLQVYGYVGANPAHSKFVKAPAVPRDGKTVALSPKACRQLLDAASEDTPVGIRDRAILAVLAYSACRVGELVTLKVGDFRTNGEHRVLSVYGKGGKERMVPLHLEAVERLNRWVTVSSIGDDRQGALFRPVVTARGSGYDGFHRSHLTTRAVANLVKKYAGRLRLDPAVTVHSLRVTALTTARERGADIIDLQDFAGHADPRTTLTYIRSRDRLSKSPAYVLHY